MSARPVGHRTSCSAAHHVNLCAQEAGILCLMDIAGGMDHLHSLGVLHVRLPSHRPTAAHVTPDLLSRIYCCSSPLLSGLVGRRPQTPGLHAHQH